MGQFDFKIIGGTPKSGKSLCYSCTHCSRRIGQNLEEEVFCGSPSFSGEMGYPSKVRFRISECSEYRAFNSPSLGMMKEIAWTIQTRKRGPTGFQPNAPPTEPDKANETEITVEPPKKGSHRYSTENDD